MDDSRLQPEVTKVQAMASWSLRKIRIARKRAIKKAKRLLGRDLLPGEVKMINNEVAKYA